jgi:hypothetical protein
LYRRQLLNVKQGFYTDHPTTKIIKWAAQSEQWNSMAGRPPTAKEPRAYAKKSARPDETGRADRCENGAAWPLVN